MHQGTAGLVQRTRMRSAAQQPAGKAKSAKPVACAGLQARTEPLPIQIATMPLQGGSGRQKTHGTGTGRRLQNKNHSFRGCPAGLPTNRPPSYPSKKNFYPSYQIFGLKY